ncbi:MAG: hypothetical protein ACOYW8_03100 [Bacillota bacterium]
MLRLAVVLLIALAAADPAWAHRVLIREEEPGVLRTYYEGEIPSPSAVVKLYDAGEALLLEGRVDAQGFFRYDRTRFPAAKAVVDDGMGHRAVIRLEAAPPAEIPPGEKRVDNPPFVDADGENGRYKDTAPPAEIPLVVRTVFGLALLLFILSFSRYCSRRRKRAPAPSPSQPVKKGPP